MVVDTDRGRRMLLLYVLVLIEEGPRERDP